RHSPRAYAFGVQGSSAASVCGICAGMLRMALTDKIRELRLRSGLSVAEIARRGGWAQPSSYHRYADPSRFRKRWLPMDVAQRLVKALEGQGSPQITADEIIALTQPMGAPSSRVASTSRVVEVI